MCVACWFASTVAFFAATTSLISGLGSVVHVGSLCVFVRSALLLCSVHFAFACFAVFAALAEFCASCFFFFFAISGLGRARAGQMQDECNSGKGGHNAKQNCKPNPRLAKMPKHAASHSWWALKVPIWEVTKIRATCYRRQ